MLAGLLGSPSVIAPPPTSYAVHLAWRQKLRSNKKIHDSRVQSSLTIKLGRRGVVTACRGLKGHSVSVTGPPRAGEPQRPPDRLDESSEKQQGYRGKWRRAKGKLHLDLNPDNRVCPQLPANNAGRRLRRQLICKPAAQLAGLERVGDDVLACGYVRGTPVDDGLGVLISIPGVGPRILLGAKPGLVAHWARLGRRAGITLTVGQAPAPITKDAWRKPPPQPAKPLTLRGRR